MKGCSAEGFFMWENLMWHSTASAVNKLIGTVASVRTVSLYLVKLNAHFNHIHQVVPMCTTHKYMVPWNQTSLLSPMASQLVQLFMQNSLYWPYTHTHAHATHTHTDHVTPSVATGCILLVLQCGLKTERNLLLVKQETGGIKWTQIL